MTKIAVIVGSVRKESVNRQLAEAIEKLLPGGTSFDYVQIDDLPMFNQDEEAAEYPAVAQRVKDRIEAADGVLIVTPEYNRGIPPLLKNAIDWATRPWGTNSFAGKPVAIAGAGAQLGTAFAQAQLRTIITFLNAKLMGQPEIFITKSHEVFNGEPIDEHTTEYLQKFADGFVAFIAK